jgi:hypothetical protein
MASRGSTACIRTSMLAVPSRAAQEHLTAHDVAEIDAEVRVALTELGKDGGGGCVSAARCVFGMDRRPMPNDHFSPSSPHDEGHHGHAAAARAPGCNLASPKLHAPATWLHAHGTAF